MLEALFNPAHCAYDVPAYVLAHDLHVDLYLSGTQEAGILSLDRMSTLKFFTSLARRKCTYVCWDLIRTLREEENVR